MYIQSKQDWLQYTKKNNQSKQDWLQYTNNKSINPKYARHCIIAVYTSTLYSYNTSRVTIITLALGKEI